MICIIGAGISGLSTADNLDNNFVVLEKECSPGGLSTQYHSGKHWFDFSGHYFHFAEKGEIKEYVERFSPFKEYKRDSRIHMFGKLIPFPVQYHLSYFPEEAGLRILNEMRSRSNRGYGSLKDSLTANFGETLYGLFFEPFMSKYYRRDLAGIIPEMDRGSIPIPDLKNVEDGLAGKNFADKGYNPVFYYPDNGLRSFIGNIEKGVSGKIRYNEAVKEIRMKERKIVTERGAYPFSKMVNTIPLRTFLGMLSPKPDWVCDAGDLESVSTLVVNLILREKRENFHWVYLPEETTPFYRAGYYPGHSETACYIERTLEEGEGFDNGRAEREVIEVLKKLNMIIDEDEIEYMDMRIIPGSYIIFNKKWKTIVPGLLEKLKENGIYSIGRYGSWNYSSMSDDIKQGIRTAEMLNGES